jgi:hypothetical protein
VGFFGGKDPEDLKITVWCAHSALTGFCLFLQDSVSVFHGHIALVDERLTAVIVAQFRERLWLQANGCCRR